jgi:Lrp/AsnC family transcriptional regulator, leucine-responsive regulatory protein
MDKLDTGLLIQLMENSRIPITQLAKKLRVSREVATYRLSRLIRDKVILDFVTEIDTEKLGFIGAAVFINIKVTRQKEFIEYIKSTNFVSWVAELSGIWSVGLSIYGKTNEELDQKFSTIYTKFKDDIIDHRFTLHGKTKYYYSKYFGINSSQKILKKPVSCKLDQTDKIILYELALNSRTESTKLSKKLSLTTPAIIQRIKKLEKSNYIKKYSIFVDVKKIGLFQYSVIIKNRNIDEKDKLISYLTEHNNISFVAEYIGDEFLEFGLFVKNPYEIRENVQEIEQKFPSNRVLEISLFQKEFVSIGPASCIFK